MRNKKQTVVSPSLIEAHRRMINKLDQLHGNEKRIFRRYLWALKRKIRGYTLNYHKKR